MADWALSPLARAELESILDFIAEDSGSADAALKVAADFEEALESLSSSPDMGWHREHLTGSRLRWWRVHRYLLIYDPSTRPLRVLRILHGSRDLEQIFR